MKYDALAKYLATLKGKVIVVDFWATYWTPCKKNFPHLVEMRRKYGKQCLVAVSVSVDDVTDKEAVAEVEKFLRDRKAAIPNFLLDEEPEVWQKKLKAEAVPLVFVFDRAGRVEKKYAEAPDHADIEKVVERLLNQK